MKPVRDFTVLAVVSLALLLQALAPPGYMAGSVENGWPVALCPEGLPSGFLDQGHHHGHHQGDDKAESVSLEGYCPLGGVLDASVPVLAASVNASTPS